VLKEADTVSSYDEMVAFCSKNDFGWYSVEPSRTYVSTRRVRFLVFLRSFYLFWEVDEKGQLKKIGEVRNTDFLPGGPYPK